MAYYYLKTGGTATGDAGRAVSKRTGSFAAMGASAYYATIPDVFLATTPPTNGDYILVSKSHSESAASIAVSGPASGQPVYLVTVSDSAAETADIAASAQFTTSSTDFNLSGVWYYYGIYVSANDDIAHSNAVAEHCTFQVTGSDDTIFQVTADGSSFFAKGCTFIGAAGSYGVIQGGSVVRLDDCTVTGITDSLVNSGFGNGGGTLICDGCDFSTITGYLVESVGGSATADDAINVSFRNCRFSGSLTGYNDEDFTDYGQRITAAGCGSSAAAEYQFHVTSYGGEADQSTTFYRDGATAFNSGQKISIKAETNSTSSLGRPFYFDMPGRFCELSDSASDVINIYLLSSASLATNDIWASVVYRDGTNYHAPNKLTLAPLPLATGSGLTTNTESWTGRTTENRYTLSLDTSADAGSDSVPIVRIYMSLPSTVVYVCPSFGLS